MSLNDTGSNLKFFQLDKYLNTVVHQLEGLDIRASLKFIYLLRAAASPSEQLSEISVKKLA